MEAKEFSEKERDKYIKDLSVVENQYKKYITKKYNLTCDGTGGGALENIDKVFFSLVSNEKYNIDQARKLYVECCEELLKRINADEKIRPYLSHYPYTEKGISIILSFRDRKDDYFDYPYVSVMFTARNILFYRIYDKKTDALQDLYEEPYQVALKKVKEETETSKEK